MASTFDALKLSSALVTACSRQGFHKPTPIQARVIPVIQTGKDVMVEAKTGSGKTLAYALPLLDPAPVHDGRPEVLVLVPTRELATQVAGALNKVGKPLGRRIVEVAGGGSLDAQAAELAKGAHVVVGTMGRIMQLRERGALPLNRLRALVLDEVDELLRGGFSGELAVLLKALPTRHQTLLFSATISHEIENVAHQFMKEPARIQLEAGRELPAEIGHRIFRTTVKRRLEDLTAFIRASKPYQTILFCGTRHETEEVQQALLALNMSAELLHGELPPPKRRALVRHFAAGDFPLLVATDLAARGLDLPGVDLVLNYSLPRTIADYTHRAGRTGRAGKTGTVVTMLIEQQQDRYETLRHSYHFEKIELHGNRVLVRPIKTREERDKQFRKQPKRAPVEPKYSGRSRGKRKKK